MTARARTVLAALLAIALAVVAAQAQPPRTPVKAPLAWIDVHMHLVAGRSPTADYPGAAEAAIREMDEFGIAMAIILPTPQTTDQRPHDYDAYANVLRRHRGRFAFLGGGGTLNATLHAHADPGKVTAEVKREFAAAAERMVDDGASGFGEIASLHISATAGHPYEFVPADHPLLLVLTDVAARRDVPIDLHMDATEGETPIPPRFAGGANPSTLPDTLGTLPRLLAHNPKAKIVWAHGASDPIGGMTAATIGRLMDAHPNLYVSLRVVGPQAPVANKVFGPGGIEPAWSELLTRHADRFVIGSDSFMVASSVRGSGPGRTFAERNAPKLNATNRFLSLLPGEIAEKIGRDNAVRIYRLTPGRGPERRP